MLLWKLLYDDSQKIYRDKVIYIGPDVWALGDTPSPYFEEDEDVVARRSMWAFL